MAEKGIFVTLAVALIKQRSAPQFLYMRLPQRVLKIPFLVVSLSVSTGFLVSFRPSADDFLTRLLDLFQKYNIERPVEKAYLHTDRAVYLPGETIWFKGYLFGGNIHTADTISKVVYVDLVDAAARKVRIRTQLRAVDSYAPGQFALPDSLPAGLYQLRAYTNFMRNESEAYYFTKSINILQPDKPIASVAASTSKVDVQFMPEGGHLVAGFDGRVAFKAVGPNGRGQTVEGFVLSSQKDTVIGFASTHLGMGTFGFKPEAGQAYTAFVKQTDGGLASYPLPAVLLQGALLQADNLSNKDNLKVYVRHNITSTDPNATLTLLAQTRGQVIQAAKIPLSRKMGVVQLLKKQFPEGIAQITLFDETNQPVCERLVFIDHSDRINVRIEPGKATYHPREKVELTITTTDMDGKPLPANLSLAAVDDRLSPNLDSNRATITSHLLLSSDLTGNIEQPAYYFDARNADRAAKLDLLLMTQGWRRFVWSDVLAGTPPPIKFPVERGLSLTGQVRKPNQKDIGGVVKLNFILTQKDTSRTTPRRLFLMGESDEQGNFGAYDLDFTDTTTVLIQGTKGRANRDLVISLDQLLTPRVTLVQPPYNPLEFNADDYAEFMRRTDEYMAIERQIRNNREILLKAVTIKAKKYVEIDNRKIYSNPDATVKFDQMNTAGRLSILDVIQGRVAGVQVSGSGFNATVQIRGAANFGGAIEPLFVIDGMPTDLQGAMSISVQDVDQVDILKGASAAIYGSRAAGGVISILTKRGSPNYDGANDPAPGMLVAKLSGYLPVKEFYAPRYDQKLPDGVDKPDYRTTLFWTPAIQTGPDGKATVSFFTSDARHPVRIQVEGANAVGMPGVGTQTLRVE